MQSQYDGRNDLIVARDKTPAVRLCVLWASGIIHSGILQRSGSQDTVTDKQEM